MRGATPNFDGLTVETAGLPRLVHQNDLVQLPGGGPEGAVTQARMQKHRRTKLTRDTMRLHWLARHSGPRVLWALLSETSWRTTSRGFSSA